MIFARRGIAIEEYPSVKAHLETFRTELEPKPANWGGSDWPGRKPGAYQWYEIQDATDYWKEFDKPKIMYPEITWRAQWSFDDQGTLASNTVYFLPTDDLWILAVINSPISWWYAWRTAVHGKDEALRFIGVFVADFPIPKLGQAERMQNLVHQTSPYCSF